MELRKSLLTLCLYGISFSVLADQPTVIINNNAPAQAAPQQPQQQPQQNQAQQNNDDGLPPGTYYQSNPHGGTDTVYTTGKKTPYDINEGASNSQPPVMPYVYPNAPAPTPPAPPINMNK